MRIALIDPFFDTSHSQWAEGLRHHSRHKIDIYSGLANFWKWQMVGGTMTLARQIGSEIRNYDLLLVTDMLDLPSFLGFLKDYNLPPVILYFHENQITYPWSPDDSDLKEKRDHHYGFMNFRSAYVANQVIFNSEYHKSSFFSALPGFCDQFPKNNLNSLIPEILEKSSVLGIGIEAEYKNGVTKDYDKPIFLWNHRWEYDKGPDLFFNTLIQLKKEGFDFGLIVLGRTYAQQPPIFELAKKTLSDHILHWGFAQTKADYYSLISQANILLVTAIQDFFGIGVVEAIMGGCRPILPLRLAYPEHIHEQFHNQIFYRNVEELAALTREVLWSKQYNDTEAFKNFVQKYRWEYLIPKYDTLFEKTVQ